MNPWDMLMFTSAARRGCSKSMLTEFEAMLGTEFPIDYRDFLIQVNGGKPVGHRLHKGCYAIIPIAWNGCPPESTDPDTEVDYLLALEEWSSVFEEDRSETLTLFGAYRMFVKEERRLPAGLIPSHYPQVVAVP